MNIFDLLLPRYAIDKSKKTRLITLFSGYDSQKLAFNYLNINVEHYKAVEFDKYAIQSLNEMHNTNFQTKDIKELKGQELEIVDKQHFTYLLTLFHALIYQLQVYKKVWKKEVVHEVACYGKLKDC